ncbi:MAG TPA: hypothetical protein VIA18_24540, partial [Polyangia bacterium]|nr:hypothetical protein [Polyangia bacterium]
MRKEPMNVVRKPVTPSPVPLSSQSPKASPLFGAPPPLQSPPRPHAAPALRSLPPPLPTAPAPKPSASTQPAFPAATSLLPAVAPHDDDARFERMLTNPTLHRAIDAATHAGRAVARNVAAVVTTLQTIKRERRIDPAQLNKWIVSTYKVVGFTVLTLIVLALVSYMGSTLFYWYSSSWLMPQVISPTDERVLQLSATLATQAGTRDKLQADYADAERVMVMQQQFLSDAKQAISDELADRKSELNGLLALNKSFQSTRAEVHSNGAAFSGLSRKRIAAEYGAHLIDRESAVAGAFQLSQIAAGNLSLAEKNVELDKRTADLMRETDSLAAIVAGKPAARHSYEILRMLQDMKRAEVELAKARDNHDAIGKSLGRYDQIVHTIQDSPYLRAAQKKDTIAFFPYDNVDKVKPGAPL